MATLLSDFSYLAATPAMHRLRTGNSSQHARGFVSLDLLAAFFLKKPSARVAFTDVHIPFGVPSSRYSGV